MPEKKNSERGLILQGIKCQPAPPSHVRKLKSRFGILKNLPSHFEDLPGAIDDRDERREIVRDIHAGGVT